jgi:hypothetical protein
VDDVRTAHQLFDLGFGATTMPLVAERAGVSVQTVSKTSPPRSEALISR